MKVDSGFTTIAPDCGGVVDLKSIVLPNFNH